MKYNETFHAFHSTFETFDLRTCMRAARTYFLTRGVKEERNIITLDDDEGVPQGYQLQIDNVSHYKDHE